MAGIRGAGIPGSTWRGCQFRLVTTAGAPFTVDTAQLVMRISFWDPAAAFTTQTVTISCENVIIFNAIPVILLQNPWSGNAQAPAAAGVVHWIPERPISFNANWPVQITPSASMNIALHAMEDIGQ